MRFLKRHAVVTNFLLILIGGWLQSCAHDDRSTARVKLEMASPSLEEVRQFYETTPYWERDTSGTFDGDWEAILEDTHAGRRPCPQITYKFSIDHGKITGEASVKGTPSRNSDVVGQLHKGLIAELPLVQKSSQSRLGIARIDFRKNPPWMVDKSGGCDLFGLAKRVGNE